MLIILETDTIQASEVSLQVEQGQGQGQGQGTTFTEAGTKVQKGFKAFVSVGAVKVTSWKLVIVNTTASVGRVFVLMKYALGN